MTKINHFKIIARSQLNNLINSSKQNLPTLLLLSFLGIILSWGFWLHCQTQFETPQNIYKMQRHLNKEWSELGGNPYDVINAQVVSKNFSLQTEKKWFVHNRKGNAYADGFFPNTQCLQIDQQKGEVGINSTPYLLGTMMQPEGDQIVLQSMYSDCWYLHFPPLNDWINSLLYSMGVKDFSSRALTYYLISLFHLLLLFLLLRRYFALNPSLMALLFYASSSLFIDWASMPLYIVWSEIFFTALLLALPKNLIATLVLIFAQVFTSINYIIPQLAVAALCKINKLNRRYSLLTAALTTAVAVSFIAINRIDFLGQSASSGHFAEVFTQRKFLNWQQFFYSIGEVFFFFRMALCTTPLLLGMLGLSCYAYFVERKNDVKETLRLIFFVTIAISTTVVVMTDTVMRHSWEYPRIFIIPLLLLFAFSANYLLNLKKAYWLKIIFAMLLIFDIYSIRRFHYHDSLLAMKINLIQESLDINPSYALTIDGYHRPPLHEFHRVSNYGLIDRDFPILNAQLQSSAFEFVPQSHSALRAQLYFIDELTFNNLVIVGSTALQEELKRCKISLIDGNYNKHLVAFDLKTTSQLKTITLPDDISFHQFEAVEPVVEKTQVIEIVCDLRQNAHLYEIFTQRR